MNCVTADDLLPAVTDMILEIEESKMPYGCVICALLFHVSVANILFLWGRPPSWRLACISYSPTADLQPLLPYHLLTSSFLLFGIVKCITLNLKKGDRFKLVVIMACLQAVAAKGLPERILQGESRSLIQLYWNPHLANEKHHVAERWRAKVNERRRTARIAGRGAK